MPWLSERVSSREPFSFPFKWYIYQLLKAEFWSACLTCMTPHSRSSLPLVILCVSVWESFYSVSRRSEIPFCPILSKGLHYSSGTCQWVLYEVIPPPHLLPDNLGGCEWGSEEVPKDAPSLVFRSSTPYLPPRPARGESIKTPYPPLS